MNTTLKELWIKFTNGDVSMTQRSVDLIASITFTKEYRDIIGNIKSKKRRERIYKLDLIDLQIVFRYGKEYLHPYWLKKIENLIQLKDGSLDDPYIEL